MHRPLAFGRKAAGRDQVPMTAGELQTLTDFYAAASRMLHDRRWDCPAERAIWELFCRGASTLRIARRVRGRGMRLRRPVRSKSRTDRVTGRTVVDVVSVTAVVRRLREELLGLRRRPGRPRKVGGYGDKDALSVWVRLDEREQAALASLQERLKLPRHLAVRAAILAAAKM